MNKNASLFYRLRPKYVKRQLVGLLPQEWRNQLLRSQFSLPTEPLGGLTIKIVHRRAELEQAFEVLHDSYVKAGYMSPHPSGLRVTSYHALPSTTTIAAFHEDEVVGTFSIIRDGPFGFPSDSIVDTRHLRGYGVRIAEISALAIRSDYRQSGGEILWPMLVYLYRYCTKLFGIDLLVIAVHPSHFPFYEALLCFESLQGETIKNYDFVNGMPAKCGTLKLRDCYKLYAMHYGRKPVDKNIFKYFIEKPFPSMRFPKRENFKISDPFLTPELLDYFFRQKTDAFELLSDNQIAILHSLYQSQEYRDVLPKLAGGGATTTRNRKDARFDFRCKGQVLLSKKRVLTMEVNSVSANGFQASMGGDIRFGEPITAQIAISDFVVSQIECYPVWSSENKTYGFRIVKSESNWADLIDDLDKDLKQQHSQPPFSILPDAL